LSTGRARRRTMCPRLSPRVLADAAPLIARVANIVETRWRGRRRPATCASKLVCRPRVRPAFVDSLSPGSREACATMCSNPSSDSGSTRHRRRARLAGSRVGSWSRWVVISRSTTRHYAARDGESSRGSDGTTFRCTGGRLQRRPCGRSVQPAAPGIEVDARRWRARGSTRGRHHPDVVVLDLVLPGRRRRSDPGPARVGNVPIVVLSVRVTPRSTGGRVDAGPND